MGSSTKRTEDHNGGFLAASGAALGWQLGIQLIVGLILSSSYVARLPEAYSSTASLHARPFMAFLQALHYWGSAILILHAWIQVVAILWTGAYTDSESRRRLAAAVLIALLALGFQLTGNLLPLDRHGVQTAGIEASVASRSPILGAQLASAVRGGKAVTEETLLLWYSIHRWALPVLSLLALALCFFRQRASKHLIFQLIPILAVALLALFVKSPLGTPASGADFESANARASWYMWPLHGMMKMFDSAVQGAGWIGALLVPVLFVGFLFGVILLGSRARRTWVRSVLTLFVAFFAVGAIGFGGQFAPLVGKRDPIELVAQSSGPAKTIDKVLAEKGRTAFNSLPCAGCHGKDGNEAGGGPALTSVWKRHNDADYYERYIKSPTSVQPSSTMPAFKDLNPDQLRAIAEFLRSPK